MTFASLVAASIHSCEGPGTGAWQQQPPACWLLSAQTQGTCGLWNAAPKASRCSSGCAYPQRASRRLPSALNHHCWLQLAQPGKYADAVRPGAPGLRFLADFPTNAQWCSLIRDSPVAALPHSIQIRLTAIGAQPGEHAIVARASSAPFHAHK